MLELTLEAGENAVVDYNTEVYTEGYDTTYPIVKLVCKTQSDYALHHLETAGTTSVTLTQTVTGHRNLVLQSNSGLLDPSSPFQPFGPIPAAGDRFYIGSAEVFRKKLSSLSLKIEWHDIPDDKLGDYYDQYSAQAIVNAHFRVNPMLRLRNEWHDTTVNRGLFVHQQAAEPKTINVGLRASHTTSSGRQFAYKRSLLEGELTEYTHATPDGFMALELLEAANGLKAFGHRQYPTLLAKASIDAALGETGAGTDQLPNPPYTPTIKDFSIDYSTEVTIPLDVEGDEGSDSKAYEKRVEKFFHVVPFGVEEEHPFTARDKDPQASVLYLMPRFGGEGTLYIGVENIEPGQNLSLLFQVAEGTSDPEAEKESIQWSYLTESMWVDFEQEDVLSDGTNQLLTSGIITFDTQKTLSDANPYLPTGTFWLRGVTQNAEAHAGVIAVHAQAVAVTFSDNDNDPTRLGTTLPASSIKKLATAQSQIKKVKQPYAAFDGRLKEEDEAYYTRVSERLRHKQRAITIWDYEHLVLEKFPDVYKVKCVNHTSKESEYAPGSVSLVVVSNLRNKNAVNPLQPKTSVNTLDEIKQYVDRISTTFVTPIVRNPDFERVRVHFRVKFRDNYDSGTYLGQIKTDINQFLSPWAYEEGKDIVFQGRIHRSMILNFVEELEYVDFVACFRMDQITDTICYEDVEEAEATHAAAILVADEAKFHQVTEITSDECDCDKEPGDSSGPGGIGYWSVGEDFEVS